MSGQESCCIGTLGSVSLYRWEKSERCWHARGVLEPVPVYYILLHGKERPCITSQQHTVHARI